MTKLYLIKSIAAQKKLGFYMTVPVIATVRFIIPQEQKRCPDQERISRSKDL